MNKDKTGLRQANFVSCLNPASHALLDTVNLNIGECAINRTDRQYPLLAKLKYLCRYSPKARNTFLRTFENYIDDTDELLKTVSQLPITNFAYNEFHYNQLLLYFFTQDIKTTYKAVTTANDAGASVTEYVPLTAQALLAEQMLGSDIAGKWEAKEQDVLIQLFSPLRNFSSLVPSSLDIQWRLNFSENKRFFVTETSSIEPQFQITGVFRASFMHIITHIPSI